MVPQKFFVSNHASLFSHCHIPVKQQLPVDYLEQIYFPCGTYSAEPTVSSHYFLQICVLHFLLLPSYVLLGSRPKTLLVVQNSSIGDLLPWSVALTKLTIRVFTTQPSDLGHLLSLRHLTNNFTILTTNTAATKTMTRTCDLRRLLKI